MLSRNSPGLKPCILRHSAIWWAADEALLNKVRKNRKNPPLKGNCVTYFPKLFLISGKWQEMLRYSFHQWYLFLSVPCFSEMLALGSSWAFSGVNETGDLYGPALTIVQVISSSLLLQQKPLRAQMWKTLFKFLINCSGFFSFNKETGDYIFWRFLWHFLVPHFLKNFTAIVTW